MPGRKPQTRVGVAIVVVWCLRKQNGVLIAMRTRLRPLLFVRARIVFHQKSVDLWSKCDEKKVVLGKKGGRSVATNTI